MEKLNEQVVEKINSLVKDGVKQANVDYLGKLVDIHKDLANEEYWDKMKEEDDMRYRSYSGRGGYGAGGSSNSSRGGSYGEYGEGGSYGRRGVPGSGRGRYRDGQGNGRYRGEEMLDEMMYHYGNYSESGQYGAEGETLKPLEYMLEAVVDFVKMLKEEANSPEEMQLIKHYSKKISEM